MREQMRRGMQRLIQIDADSGVITRSVKTDNGRGSLIDTGEYTEHQVMCRVSYEGGGVWKHGQWEGGNVTDITPYVLAMPETDIAEGDILDWRGKKYTVGSVTRPGLDGGAVVLQAALVEVKNGG